MEQENIYKGTPGIAKLRTNETPHQILSEDFPKHQWPISGGWGYTQDDAVVIETSNSGEGVALEYKFLEYRTYEEAIVFRHKGERLAGFRFERGIQSLVEGDNHKFYDKLTMKVTAFTEQDLAFLKNEWDSHNAYNDDEDGRQRHLLLADSKRISYKIVGWFDITMFY